MAHHTVASRIDFQPTGRALPFIPAPASAHPEIVAAGPCPAFRDCEDATPGHYDHYAHSLKVTEDDGVTPIITAGMVSLSGDEQHPVVYLRNAEFANAAALKAKTAEMRRFLDEVDALADRVFDDHKGHGRA